MKIKRLLFRGCLVLVVLALLGAGALMGVYFWLVGRLPTPRAYFPDATLNGQPVRMGLDTGGDGSFSIGREQASRLDLQIDGPETTVNVNEHDTGVWLSKPAKLQTGTESITVPLKEGDSRQHALFELGDNKLDMNVGWPAVRDNILVFDSSRHTIRAVPEVPPETAGWLKLKVHQGNIHILLLEIPLADGAVGIMVVDTGNPTGIELAPAQWKAWRAAHPQAPSSAVKLTDGNNGAPIESVWADEIKLGALTLTDVPLMKDTLPQDFFGKDVPPDEFLGGEHYLGMMGLYALERMDLVVDAKNNQAYLKPKPPPGPPYPGFDRPNATSSLPMKRDWTVAASVRLQGDNAFGEAAEIKLRNKDYDGAIGDYTQALELDPNNAGFLDDRGNAREFKGDHDGAIADYTKALELEPKNASFYNGRGTAKANKKDRAGAMADYSKAIELDPKNARFHAYRGTVEGNNGDHDGAIADYTKALELDPKNAGYYDNRGDARMSEDDCDGALADYSKALELDPKDADYLYDRGSAKQDKGDYVGAMADFNHGIELDPKIARNYYGRGAVRQIQGDFPGAVADYDKAIELQHGDAPYWQLYRQLVLMKLGKAPADFAQNEAGWRDGWTKSLGQFIAGKLDEAALLSAATNSGDEPVAGQQCEACYFIGMMRLLKDDQAGARDYFNQCIATGKRAYGEYVFARAELARLDSAIK